MAGSVEGRRRRRLVLGLAGGALAALLLAPAGEARRSGQLWSDPHLQRLRRQAITRGCDYLAGKQREDMGGRAWGDNRAVVATTALCTLALMADGSTDNRGRHGLHVKLGIDFLLSLVENRPADSPHPEGYFYYAQDNNSRMHGQGFATLALATALGTGSNTARAARIRDVLRKAIRCIEQAQTTSGGFGYDPQPGQDHEGSVTVAVAQGLRAARDVGLHVNRQSILRGLHYLKRSQNDDGSFRYSMHVQRSSYALTAAALSSFLLYGEYGQNEPERIRKGFDYMMRELQDVCRSKEWWSYGQFYAAWAAWQWDGGDWDPASQGVWARWHPVVYEDLLRTQSVADGSWYDVAYNMEQQFGPELITAFSVLTLAIPDEGIPIFQR